MKENFFKFLKEKYLEAKKSRFSKQAQVVFSGTAFNYLLGFISTIIIIRSLEPSLYGLLSIALAFAVIVGEVGDFGISATIIRFVPKYLKLNSKKAESILKVSFFLKFLTSFLITLFGFLLSFTLANYFFKKPELTLLLKITFLGAFGILFSQFTITVLQTRMWFLKMVFIQTIPNLIKIIGVLVLFSLARISPSNILILFVGSFYLAFLFGYILIPKQFQKVRLLQKESFSEVINFSKWIFISLIFASLYRQLDILMLGRYLESAKVGIYAAALQLTVPFAFFITSLQTVFFPRAAEIIDKEKLKIFSQKIIGYIVLVFLLFGPFALLIKFLVGPLFGAKYLEAGGIFLILFFHIIVLSFRSPISVLLCVLDKPNISSFVDILRLFLGILIFSYAIPHFGLYGAAFTILSISFFATAIEGLFVLKYLKS